MTALICGVDVGADTLDVRIGRDGPRRAFANTPEGRTDLAASCWAQEVGLEVMEATGGYERAVLGALWAEGVPAAIVDPRPVRHSSVRAVLFVVAEIVLRYEPDFADVDQR